MTTGDGEIISCTIFALEEPVDVSWIDPEGEEIAAGFSAGYILDDGKHSYRNGIQTTTLVIKAAQVALIDSPKTYKCAVTSIQNAGSPTAEKSIILSPGIGSYMSRLLWTQINC